MSRHRSRIGRTYPAPRELLQIIAHGRPIAVRPFRSFNQHYLLGVTNC